MSQSLLKLVDRYDRQLDYGELSSKQWGSAVSNDGSNEWWISIPEFGDYNIQSYKWTECTNLCWNSGWWWTLTYPFFLFICHEFIDEYLVTIMFGSVKWQVNITEWNFVHSANAWISWTTIVILLLSSQILQDWDWSSTVPNATTGDWSQQTPRDSKPPREGFPNRCEEYWRWSFFEPLSL